jgi:dTDP-4-amino-4,6-dideoxygalactose transaminase
MDESDQARGADLMGNPEEPVYVTKPFLPPLEEFQEYLRAIWGSKSLTNNGRFHRELEKALCEYLGVPFISLFSNGTLALITALQALRITGEVITTPFSFVATTHALWWNGILPVFVDIETDTCNLNPDKIEAAITPKTTAILPVHVYGNPCDVKRIEEIAHARGLRVIYDACHTFDVKIGGEPVLNFGDLSVMSFHATKVFTTFEGGAIVSHDAAMKKQIDLLKNFGFAGETTVIAPGINAKMNEFQAALGVLQLKYIDRVIERRKSIVACYKEELHGIEGISYIDDLLNVRECHSYFPVFIDKAVFGRTRDEVYEVLKKQNIYARRYFYPLISQFPTYRQLESAQPGKMPVAEKITEEVLCMPLFPELDENTVRQITSFLK